MKHVVKGKKSANKTSGLDSRVTTSSNRYEPIHLGNIKAKLALIGWNLVNYIEQSYYKSNTKGFGLYQLVFRHNESNQDIIVISGNNTETLAGIYTGLNGIPYICLLQTKHDKSYTNPAIFESKCLELAESVKNGNYKIDSHLTSENLNKLYNIACFYKNETNKGLYCSYPELIDQFSTIQGFFAWFFNPGNSKMKLDRIIRIRDIAVQSYTDLTFIE